jgi:hypothetical protein
MIELKKGETFFILLLPVVQVSLSLPTNDHSIHIPLLSLLKVGAHPAIINLSAFLPHP